MALEQQTLKQKMGKLAESKQWYEETLVHSVIQSLERNHITGFYVKSKEEALKKVRSLIP